MISYRPLFMKLAEKGIKKHELIKLIGTSSATIAKFSSNGNVTMDVIDRLCRRLKCQPGDLIEYIPDEMKKQE